MEAAAVALLRQSFTAEQADLLARHLDLVREWNERINLTRITADEEMVVKHVLDSAAAVRALPLSEGMRVLDVGTGPGFPGVPLKVLHPGIDLFLLEATQKKARFLEVVRDAVLSGACTVLVGRAEEWGKKPGYREAFDLVCARAVAEMRVLAELCLPFCRLGGHFIAWKGPGGGEEAQAARRALQVLGGRLERVVPSPLPLGMGEHTLVVVRKVAPTPAAYPRRPGMAGQKPIM